MTLIDAFVLQLFVGSTEEYSDSQGLTRVKILWCYGRTYLCGGGTDSVHILPALTSGSKMRCSMDVSDSITGCGHWHLGLLTRPQELMRVSNRHSVRR